MTIRNAASVLALLAAFSACTKPTEPAQEHEASAPTPPPSASQAEAEPEPDAAALEVEAPAPPGKCPSASNLAALYALDWTKQFPLSPDVAARAKGIAGTAAETKAYGHDVETELRAVCSKMAVELGVKDAFTSSALACGAAGSALKQLREKLGPAAKVKVAVRAPTCTAALEGFAGCVAKCDAVLDASTPETGCQGHAPVGKCSGVCEGACEPQPAGKCSGTCTGSCDGGFHGTCKGICKGTCNGKELKTPGACAGTCDGACEGEGRGECKAGCHGGCETHAEVCSGICLGKCGSDLKEVKCTGSFKASGASEECRAYCETRSDRHASCGAAQVVVDVTGAKDAAAAKTYVAAIEHHMPAVAKIGLGLEARIRLAEGNVKLVTTGVKTVTQASDSEEIRAVTPCLSGFVQPATEGAVALKGARTAAIALLAAAK